MALFDDEEKLMATDDGQDVEGQASEVGVDEKYLGFIIAACILPFVFIVWTVGTFDSALSSGVCLGMNMLAVGNCWDLRRRWWFWCVVAFMLALNVPLILAIHWPHRRIPSVALLPIGLADMGITVGAVRFVQHFIVRYKPPEKEHEG